MAQRPQRPELSGQLEKLCLAAYKAGEQVSGRASHLGAAEGDPAHCGWSQVRKNGGKDTHGTSYHDDEDGSNSEWLCCGGIVHGARKRGGVAFTETSGHRSIITTTER